MRRFSLHRTLRAGFSLIEVNMAIFVLAGGALALLGLFPLGLRESLAARNEMRVAAFCERFMGAARTVAEKPGVTDADKLLNALERDFNFRIGDPVEEDDKVEAHEDPERSGVWYRAWWREPRTTNVGNIETVSSNNPNRKIEAVQVCVQATGENCSKNTRPLKTAPVYVVDIFVSSVNKE